jgi:hypothetical protein
MLSVMRYANGRIVQLGCIVALAVATAAPLFAADTFYLGPWEIAAAKQGPWANAETWKRSAPEAKKSIGTTVTFEPKAIRGRGILACDNPKYELKDYSVDMLFQGMFGEMHARDNAADPVKLAGTLGFRGTSWKTLETGCEGMIDFHFIDRTTAAFALNNYVYILKRKQ